MPRHSPRPTAGRKPKARGTPAAGTTPKVVRPRTLTPAERAMWNRLAPAAIAAGTLVPTTVPGFELLVQVAVIRETLDAIIQREGLVIDGKAHPLHVGFRQVTQRCESLMARFCLTAPGRSVPQPKAATENPWAAREARIVPFPKDDTA